MMDKFMCAGCENEEVDNFSIYNGCLLCSYCLEDWFNSGETITNWRFQEWTIKQREKMKLDRIKDEANCVGDKG